MTTTTEIINGEEYLVTTFANGATERRLNRPAPPPPPVVLVPKDIIVERCTDAEWRRFRDPSTIAGITAADEAKVRRIYDLFMTKSGDVNVASPRAAAIGTVLVQTGVLATSARAAEIFAPV